jgi:hypothetical protein
MTKLEQYWLNLCLRYLSLECDGYLSIRKFFVARTFYIPWEIFETGIKMDYSDFGYSEGKGKVRQMTRNYFNQAELEKLKFVFASRNSSKGKKGDQSCITARMGAAEKSSRSQGHCMQCLTINHLEQGKKPKILTLDLYYRTTEVTQKFLADLKFLSEVVFPFIMEDKSCEWRPTGVRFVFSSLYISLLYLPIIYQFKNPLDVLSLIKESDEKFYFQVLSGLRSLMVKNTNYNFRTRENMHNFFHERTYPSLSKIDRSKILKLTGEPR